jgi:hypothetical protein
MDFVNETVIRDPLLKWFAGMLVEKKLVPGELVHPDAGGESSVFIGAFNHLLEHGTFSIEEYNRELEKARKNQLAPYQDLTALGICAVVHLLERKDIVGVRDAYFRMLESETGDKAPHDSR